VTVLCALYGKQVFYFLNNCTISLYPCTVIWSVVPDVSITSMGNQMVTSEIRK